MHDSLPGARSAASGAGARRAALHWALLHAPLVLLLYASPIAAAVRSTPAPWRAWLVPTFLPQIGLIALAYWLLGLPFSYWPRAYRFAAPAATALGTVALAVDSRIYGAVGYHMNGFFFALMSQPTALREAGVPLSDVVLLAAAGTAFVALDLWAGAVFLRRSAPPRRAWALALVLFLAAAAERFYGGTMVHFGGASFFAASTVLPLQAPIRVAGLVNRILGRPANDPFAGPGAAAARIPAPVEPAEFRFARRPDMLFIVAESLPADHLDPQSMPNLWRRGLSGARFLHHYAGACNTEHGIFSAVYGLQAQRLDAVVGAGRRAPLFGAFKANGYGVRVLASSCVDWMGLKETVFGDVKDVLQTWCAGHDPQFADVELIAAAKGYVASAPADQPLFLFLFFFGTHFNYFYEPQDRYFTPDWDGIGALRATAEPGWKIQNRARNAARTLDRRIEGLLSAVEASRGRPPLVFFTGDHGEEFRQKGHLGHGSQVTREQVNVPGLWLGPGVPAGVHEAPTSQADVVPTLFRLLGDAHPPALYSDGMSMFDAPPERFVVTTVGWEPRYAVVGRHLKVEMYAGVGVANVTDADDKPLPDGKARLARDAGGILRALRGEPEPTAVAR